MIKRFALYGFLKNQRYFEPFLILILLEKGLTFFTIGILVSFREIVINLFEIPSGAIADLYGRRTSMILSFLFYILSFILFSFCQVHWQLFFAMFFFSIGETFRTGTHKAMIFDYIERENLKEQKTQIYGYTRSWSKMGSAVSVIIATIILFIVEKYSWIFLFSVIPYTLGILNFLSYPKYLNNQKTNEFSPAKVMTHLMQSFKETFYNKKLRLILVEAMGFEGLYKSSKDYIQPILQQFAFALPILLTFSHKKRTALLIAIIYCINALLSSIASKKAHLFAKKLGNEEKASNILWFIYTTIFIALIFSLFYKIYPVTIILFLLMTISQNLWRPINITRVDNNTPKDKTATILSIESQSKSFITMLLAPILGFLIDSYGFTPLGIIGSILSLLIITLKLLLENKQKTKNKA